MAFLEGLNDTLFLRHIEEQTMFIKKIVPCSLRKVGMSDEGSGYSVTKR